MAKKAYSPAMSEADFRRIVNTLRIATPDAPNGGIIAVTPDIRNDCAPHLDHQNELYIVPSTDVSSTPEGVPFCTFVIQTPTPGPGEIQSLVASGFLFWDDDLYTLRACLSHNPNADLGKADADVNIDAYVSAMGYCVKSAYPNLFMDEWPNGSAPIYVRRHIKLSLSENGYDLSDDNIKLYWNEIQKRFASTNTPNFVINYLAFEDHILFSSNRYSEIESEAFDAIENKLAPSESDSLTGDYFERAVFASNTANW